MPNGTRIATQDNTGVRWNHKDPNLKSFRSTGPNGAVLGSGTSDLDWDHVETDADGKSVGFIDPGISFPAPFNDLFQSQNPFGSIVNGQFTSYSVDGIMVPKDYFAAMLDFAFGSQFGVVERQARLSRGRYLGSRYSYRDAFGQTHGTDRSGAITQAAEGNRTVIENRFWLVSDQSWAVNLSLISVQTQQQTQPQTQTNEPPGLYKYYNPKKDFKAFLKANPNCKKALKQLGVNIEDLFQNANITNTVTDPSDLGKTYRQLGSTEKDMQELQLDYARLEGNANFLAEAILGTNKVYLFPKFFRPGSSSGRGSTIIHELLHIAFGDHVAVANRLGYAISRKPLTMSLPAGRDTWDPITGLPILAPSLPLTLELNDGIANIAIDEWLNNNCTKPN